MQASIRGERGEELVQEGVRTAVQFGMNSPFRAAILDGVESAEIDGPVTEDDTGGNGGRSTGRTLLQGLAAAGIMSLLLYALIRRIN